MRGPRKHPFGCTCRTHKPGPWNRPEHWTVAEVRYLEGSFGLLSDEMISRRVGRSVVGLRLKAKRLGLHKRAAGFSARSVAQIFGIDDSVVSKVWIRRGLMTSKRAFFQGPHRIHLVAIEEPERFIRDHPEYVDVAKMPSGWYRDLAARDPWISLVDVMRLTGRNNHAIALLIREGRIRGRRRGPIGTSPRPTCRASVTCRPRRLLRPSSAMRAKARVPASRPQGHPAQGRLVTSRRIRAMAIAVPRETVDTYGGLVLSGETPEAALRRLERRPDFTTVLARPEAQRLLEDLGRPDPRRRRDADRPEDAA